MKEKHLLVNYLEHLHDLGLPVADVFVEHYEVKFNLMQSDLIVPLLQFLQNYHYTQVDQLIDIAVEDILLNGQRHFKINYVLLSSSLNVRWVITCFVDASAPLQNSIISIFSCANWMEREIWDLFGICFLNHVDLRRILTDYGFRGHPLRKDFVVTGYFEVAYNDVTSTIEYLPISSSQVVRPVNEKNRQDNTTLPC